MPELLRGGLGVELFGDQSGDGQADGAMSPWQLMCVQPPRTPCRRYVRKLRYQSS